MDIRKGLVLTAAMAAVVAAPSAFATYGMFSHGYGMRAKGMAGASTAMTSDTFGGANNPASMVWVGDRLDVGIDWFSPIRSAERTGSSGVLGTVGSLNAKSDSDTNNFFIPEIGFNMMWNPNLSFGITAYGNGGMNTNYPDGVLNSETCGLFPGGTSSNSNILCGTGRLGVNLEQLIIAPTVAYKISQNHSIGVSPLFGYQRFRAEGLSAFQDLSQDSSKLTNNGNDSATGWGVRIGWLGKLTNAVSAGVAYSTKVDMSKFDKYKGLFAEQGNLDVPENHNIGIAVKASNRVTVAVDKQWINYSKVRSIGNPSTNSGSLGADDGRGFGWRDVDVSKIGIEYRHSDTLTLRAGYGRTDNPVQARDVTFNILAPAVVQDHYTLGLSSTLSRGSEITATFMHAKENEVSGPSLISTFGTVVGVPVFTGGNETIKMHQNSLGVAWTKRW